MLASIIANLQNLPQAEVRPPTINVDRGGGGPLWGPRYDIVDILAAAQSFPEISGEHPVARAVRRTRWIGEALPKIREARERRDAAMFLAGATIADAAAEERHKLIDRLKIEQLVEIIDEVRGAAAVTSVARTAPSPISRPRGCSGPSSRLGRGEHHIRNIPTPLRRYL